MKGAKHKDRNSIKNSDCDAGDKNFVRKTGKLEGWPMTVTMRYGG